MFLNQTVTFTRNSTLVGDIALGTAYTIVGVMPPGFHFPDDRIEFWTSAALTRPRDARQRTSMLRSSAKVSPSGRRLPISPRLLRASAARLLRRSPRHASNSSDSKTR
jgi:hypothetical protein